MKMTCMEAVKRLVDYLHKELDDVDESKINEHLEDCSQCCGKFEFEEKLTRVVKDKVTGDTCPEKIRKSILQKLRMKEL